MLIENYFQISNPKYRIEILKKNKIKENVFKFTFFLACGLRALPFSTRASTQPSS